MDRKLVGAATKFIVVGGVSTLVNYGTFYVLTKFLHVNPILASISGYITGLILGFFLNNFWTFENRTYNPKLIAGYCLVYLISLGLSTSFLWLVVHQYHQNPYYMNIVAIGISTVFNFVGLKTIIYKNEPEEIA